MMSKSLAKEFLKDSQNYMDAAIVLNQMDYDHYNPNMIYPVLYLIRHAFELLLKSLILDFVPNQLVNLKNMKVDLWEECDKPFDIKGTHSLLVLFDRLSDIDQQQVENGKMLFSRIETGHKEVKKILVDYDGFDKQSDYYRYPVYSQGEISYHNLWKKYSEEDIISEIKPEPNQIPHLKFYGEELIGYYEGLDINSIEMCNNLITVYKQIVQLSSHYIRVFSNND